MTTTLIRVNTTTAPAPASPGRPKLTLVDDRGTRVVLPFAPIEGPLSNLAPRWEEVARSGQRPPLLIYAGPNLARLDLEATVTNTRNPTASAELYLYALTTVARQARRVFLRNYGSLVGNPWRITGFSATPFRRTATNEVAGFTASLSLTAAVDPVVRVGSLTGGARALTPPPARTITVKAGETATALAYRALGDTSAATALLDANGIRDPRALTAGMVLKVP